MNESIITNKGYEPKHISSIGYLNEKNGGYILPVYIFQRTIKPNYFVHVSYDEFKACNESKELMKQLACDKINEKVKSPSYYYESENYHIF